MSSNSSIRSVAEEAIHVIIPPARPQEDGNQAFLAIEHEEKSTSVLLATIIAFPQGVYHVFMDRLSMLIFLELFNVAFQMCKVTGGEEAVPFLTLFAAPIYLFHSMHKAYQRFAMVVTALKAHDLASALFFFTDGAYSASVGVAVTRKSLWGGAKVSGLLTKVPMMSFIFTLIMPIIMVVVGAVGGIANGWSLFHSLNALREWNKQSNGANKDLDALIETLEFIKGPEEPTKGDEEADKIFNKRMAQYKVDKWHFANRHGSTHGRYGELKGEVSEFLETHNLHALPTLKEELSADEVNAAVQNFIVTVKQHITPTPAIDDTQIEERRIKEVYILLDDVQKLHTAILTSEEGKELALVGQMKALFSRVEELSTASDLEEIFRNKEDALIHFIDAHLAELVGIEKDLAKGKRLTLEARSELHRKLICNAASLLVSCMVLTAGILILVNHHYAYAATIVTIASSTINFLKAGGTKLISKKQFADMEALMNRLLSCCRHES